MKPALRAHTARKAGELRGHPGPETLADYHEGRLGEEVDRVRDHLALCSECAEFLLELSAFAQSEPAAEAAGPTEGEVQAAWQAMQARLGGEGRSRKSAALTGPQVVHLPPPPARPEPSRARPTWTWAMAASWLLVAGLGVWVAVLERENTQLRTPSAEVATVDLHAAEPTRGGAEPAERQSVSAGHSAVLHLEAPDLLLRAGYEAEIVAEGSSGGTVWKGRASRDPKEKDFTVSLPAGFLRPGLYQVRLYGEGGGKTALLAEFPLEVRAP